jgi:hypothetical protein
VDYSSPFITREQKSANNVAYNSIQYTTVRVFDIYS